MAPGGDPSPHSCQRFVWWEPPARTMVYRMRSKEQRVDASSPVSQFLASNAGSWVMREERERQDRLGKK